ncbi:MAG: hypothetical protein KTR32_31855 [Granulosicoccus sp.]|nr:hypothetical protein [Granulosicoccus sp.]
MKFNRLGIPILELFDGETGLAQLKMTVSDRKATPFGIQWQRYHEDARQRVE